MKTVRFKNAVRVVAMAFVLIAGTATGMTPEEELVVKTQAIHFTRAELSNPAGVKHLYRRIERAARSVCGYVDIFNYRQSPEFEKCYERAVNDAVTKLGSRAVTALHHDQRP